MVVGALWFVGIGDTIPEQPGSNIRIVDGKQIITVNAKGGYRPRMTIASAGMPTTLNVATSGTFDCSAAFTIPSLNYRTMLKPSGITEIEIPPQKAGTILRGLCGMGMYNFAVQFE